MLITNQTATDNAAGQIGSHASIHYQTGAITLRPDIVALVPVPEYVASKIGTKKSADGATVTDTYRQIFSGYRWARTPAVFPYGSEGKVTVRYFSAGSATAKTASVPFEPEIDVTPGYKEQIVTDSVVLRLGGKEFTETGGELRFASDGTQGSGTRAGFLNHATGRAKLTAWPTGSNTSGSNIANSGEVLACVTSLGAEPVDEIHFRTAAAPIRPGSLSIKYHAVDAAQPEIIRAGTDGTITGDLCEGTVDVRTGVCALRFGRWVTVTDEIRAKPWFRDDAIDPATGKIWQHALVHAADLTYSAVAYSYIPLDKNIIGIDPVRLPLDGRVPIFRAGDVAVIHHAQSAALAASAGATADCGRTNLTRVIVYDEGNTQGGTVPGGVKVPSTQYDANLATGQVTLLDATGLTGPLRVEHRIEDVAMVSEVQISGQLTFSRGLARDYPAGSGVSSALIAGDMFASASNPFDQRSWTDEWSDARIGNQVSAEYNAVTYPIEVDNIGAITERWALIFTNTSTVRVVGESVGQIAQQAITADIAPINPVTNRPYFTIRAAGWGGGWATGNVLRFNTTGAQAPIWIARTVQQGPGQEGADGFRVQIRGDIDAQP